MAGYGVLFGLNCSFIITSPLHNYLLPKFKDP